jgi:hypothetical protein
VAGDLLDFGPRAVNRFLIGDIDGASEHFVVGLQFTSGDLQPSVSLWQILLQKSVVAVGEP